MSKEYDNTNSGALFVNNRKTTEKHPDYTGSVNVDGKEYWLSGWKRHKQSDGQMYLSIAVTPKEPKQASGGTKAPEPFGIDVDDDIPF